MTLALAACVSLPPPSPVPLDIVVPAVWSRYPSASTPGPVSSATASPLGLWWQHFNDPLLDQLIAQALQANSTIKIAKAALLQSRALRDVSAAGLMPGINASASTQRSKAGDASPGNTLMPALTPVGSPIYLAASAAPYRSAKRMHKPARPVWPMYKCRLPRKLQSVTFNCVARRLA